MFSFFFFLLICQAPGQRFGFFGFLLTQWVETAWNSKQLETGHLRSFPMFFISFRKHFLWFSYYLSALLPARRRSEFSFSVSRKILLRKLTPQGAINFQSDWSPSTRGTFPAAGPSGTTPCCICFLPTLTAHRGSRQSLCSWISQTFHTMRRLKHCHRCSRPQEEWHAAVSNWVDTMVTELQLKKKSQDPTIIIHFLLSPTFFLQKKTPLKLTPKSPPFSPLQGSLLIRRPSSAVAASSDDRSDDRWLRWDDSEPRSRDVWGLGSWGFGVKTMSLFNPSEKFKYGKNKLDLQQFLPFSLANNLLFALTQSFHPFKKPLFWS